MPEHIKMQRRVIELIKSLAVGEASIVDQSKKEQDKSFLI